MIAADLGRIAPGQAQYTLCCTPGGGVVDDVIVYLVGPDEVEVHCHGGLAAVEASGRGGVDLVEFEFEVVHVFIDMIRKRQFTIL